MADDDWPVSDWRCPNCQRYVGQRVVHKTDERGWATGVCGRCGAVDCLVLGWMDKEGNFA